MPSSTKARAGHEEAVERVGRVDRRERNRGAGRGEDARDVRGRRRCASRCENSRRRVHSPAAIRPVASRPPRKTRTLRGRSARPRSSTAPGRCRRARARARRSRPPSSRRSAPRSFSPARPVRRTGGGRRLRGVCDDLLDRGLVHARRRRAAAGGEIAGGAAGARCGSAARRAPPAPPAAARRRSAMRSLSSATAARAAMTRPRMRRTKHNGDDRHDDGNEVHDYLPCKVRRRGARQRQHWRMCWSPRT